MPRSSTTPLADYARYYTGLALTKLERYSEADKVLGDLAVAPDRWAPSGRRRLPAGRSPRSAEGFQGRGRDLRIARDQEARAARRPRGCGWGWRPIGAGRPARSVEALQRAYYDYPTTAEADQAGAELDRQDVDIDAALAPKELARAETLFQARRWTHARASYRQGAAVCAPTPIASAWPSGWPAAEIALGRHREGRDALRPMLDGPLADEANFHYMAATRGLDLKDEHRALARAFVEQISDQPVRRGSAQQPGLRLHRRR